MENNESQLTETLQKYKDELAMVLSAITVDSDETLIELKTKLEEVIALTEADLLEVKKKNLLSELNINWNNNDITEASQSTKYDGDNDNADLNHMLNQLIGNKCRAPFKERNGDVRNHNAIIMSVDHCESQCDRTNASDVKIKVLFSNPICESMFSCPFFLNGNCKYGDDKCRYSHGYSVSLNNIKEFEEMDYSTLRKDSLCLAKCKTDGIWYKAIVEDYRQENDKIVVKYLHYDCVETIDFEDILPFSNENDCIIESNDDSSNDDDQIDDVEDNFIPTVIWCHDQNSSVLAQWERHTKGIGSKLMKQMGYVWGQGLGKNSDGRIDPIEAVVLPMGKSLDTCMEMKENKMLRDPMKDKVKSKAKKDANDAKIAAGYDRVKQNESVFDFINNRISFANHSKSKDSSDSKSNVSEQIKVSSDQNLNVSSFKISEEIKKAHFELNKIKSAIERNKSKNKTIVLQLEEKLKKHNDLIQTLMSKERAIIKEQKNRNDKQKLSIF